MTLALTTQAAEKLYGLLDDHIGVFRSDEVSAGAERFYEEKRKAFLESFSQEIPEVYWFQSATCPSVELHSTSAGFEVICTHPHRSTKQLIDQLNKRLRQEDFEFAGV